MIKLKEGVNLNGIKPEMLIALSTLEALYDRINRDCIITSGVDGKHSENSRHYSGNALDFRIRHLFDGEDYEITAQDIQIASDIVASAKTALGKAFYILLEATHIHVEYRGYYAIN